MNRADAGVMIGQPAHAAIPSVGVVGTGTLRSGMVSKNQRASTSGRSAMSIKADQCSGGTRFRERHWRTLMLSIPSLAAMLGGPPSLAIRAR